MSSLYQIQNAPRERLFSNSKFVIMSGVWRTSAPNAVEGPASSRQLCQFPHPQCMRRPGTVWCLTRDSPAVPEGRPKIAQDEVLGNPPNRRKVPKGRLKKK